MRSFVAAAVVLGRFLPALRHITRMELDPCRAVRKFRHSCMVALSALSIVVLLNVLDRHSLREKSA